MDPHENTILKMLNLMLEIRGAAWLIIQDFVIIRDVTTVSVNHFLLIQLVRYFKHPLKVFRGNITHKLAVMKTI